MRSYPAPLGPGCGVSLLGDSVGRGRQVGMIQVQTLSLPALRRRQPLSGQSNRQRESPNESRAAVHPFGARTVGLMFLYGVDSFILVTSVSA